MDRRFLCCNPLRHSGGHFGSMVWNFCAPHLRWCLLWFQKGCEFFLFFLLLLSITCLISLLLLPFSFFFWISFFLSSNRIRTVSFLLPSVPVSVQALEQPVRTNQIPRQIPEQSFFTKPVPGIVMGGILPFGCIFIQLFFILNSIW